MNTITNRSIGLASRAVASDLSYHTLDSSARSATLARTWTILRYTFGLVPIVAGLDKFTDYLANWESYLNPMIFNVIPLGAHTIMQVVGVIEIAAGILVLARPRVGGYIVTAWLTCIALSLIAGGRYLDVAVRDLVMAVGAFALANLTSLVDRARETEPLR